MVEAAAGELAWSAALSWAGSLWAAAPFAELSNAHNPWAEIPLPLGGLQWHGNADGSPSEVGGRGVCARLTLILFPATLEEKNLQQQGQLADLPFKKKKN